MSFLTRVSTPTALSSGLTRRSAGRPQALRVLCFQHLHRRPDAADPRVKPEDDDGVGRVMVMGRERSEPEDDAKGVRQAIVKEHQPCRLRVGGSAKRWQRSAAQVSLLAHIAKSRPALSV